MLYAIKGLDLGSQIYKRYSDTESTVSFAGHFVGFVAGITFGCYILKNVESRKGELYVTPMREGQSALISVLSSRQGARLPLCRQAHVHVVTHTSVPLKGQHMSPRS